MNRIPGPHFNNFPDAADNGLGGDDGKVTIVRAVSSANPIYDIHW